MKFRRKILSKSGVNRATCLTAQILFLLLCIKALLSLHHTKYWSEVHALASDSSWRALHEPYGPHYYRSEACLARNSTLPTPTDFAIVFGGLGGYAKFEAFKCTLAVESLIKVARYDGEVYVITEDRAHTCIPPEAHIRAQTGSEKIYVMYTDSSKPSPVETPGEKVRIRKYLQDMSIKMDIFEYLPEHITIAAWYDCDVVFAVDNCANDNLLCSLPTFSEKVPLYNTWGSHVGSFMAHRKHSENLLRRWKQELYTGQHVSDYPALQALYDEQGTNTDDRWEIGRFVSGNFAKNSYSPDLRVLRAEEAAGEQLAHWRDVMWDRHTPNSCIMHLTQGRCARSNNGRVATDALLRTLGLSTLGDVKYCAGTPRKIVLQQGISRAFPSCQAPPADLIIMEGGKIFGLELFKLGRR
jgi:hypothetical protein